MKGSRILILALTVAVSTALPAFGATVMCNGNACGGGGPRNYLYEMTVDWTGFDYFSVMTGDPLLSRYTNWMGQYWDGSAWYDLAGQQIQLLPNEEGWSDPEMTSHGQVTSHAVRGDYTIYWQWTPVSATQYRFGFDNSCSPEDVDWYISGTDAQQKADWSQALGWGYGPVHGPMVPEPSGILVVSGGLLGLLGFARRKRG